MPSMKWLRGCVAAFRFLTVLPLPTTLGTDPEDLPRSLYFYPAVGLCLAVAAAAAAFVLWNVVPEPVAAVLLTFLLLAFSGALHLDGLADTADGFFSGRDRVRTLEIMRDSRVGVMGVVALVMFLLLKVTALMSLDRNHAVRAVFFMPLAGRCGLLVMMALLPYARPAGGLATIFFAAGRAGPALSGLAILFGTAWILAGPVGLAASLLAMVIVTLFSLYCRRKIGGATGDTLGAACEAAETGFLLFYVFLHGGV